MKKRRATLSLTFPLRSLLHLEKTSVGSAPGTLRHIGTKKTERVRMHIHNYSDSTYNEKDIDDVPQIPSDADIHWIEIIGLHNTEIIRSIGETFSLHPLLLEDILNTSHRPKIEEYDNAIFFIVKYFIFDEKEHTLLPEQISIVLTKNCVLSFQERPGDPFETIRERLRTHTGKLRTSGADYLSYRLIDTIVDSYYATVAHIGEDIAEMEERLTENPTNAIVQEAYALRRSLLHIRQVIAPLREMLGRLERTDLPIMQESTIPYLHDVQDHILQVNDTLDMYRDTITGMLEAHIAHMTNRMNEVMKTLTIIATIFIPLTFVVGIYGMNFEYMPELAWQWGYPIILGVMGIIFLGMITYFRKKGWW